MLLLKYETMQTASNCLHLKLVQQKGAGNSGGAKFSDVQSANGP